MYTVLFTVFTAVVLATSLQQGVLAKPNPSAVVAFLQSILQDIEEMKSYEAAELQEQRQQTNTFMDDEVNIQGGYDDVNIQGGCDCDYHSGGCTISKAPPKNKACKCSYKGWWTCGGSVVDCKDRNNAFCKNPDSSVFTCIQGGGDCQGYSGADSCDCCYNSDGGCKVCKPPPKNYACKCHYKGAWTCGGEVTQCIDTNNEHCKNPDKSAATCVQGRGDCDGYPGCDCGYNSRYMTSRCAVVIPPPAGTKCKCENNSVTGCHGYIVFP